MRSLLQHSQLTKEEAYVPLLHAFSFSSELVKHLTRDVGHNFMYIEANCPYHLTLPTTRQALQDQELESTELSSKCGMASKTVTRELYV